MFAFSSAMLIVLKAFSRSKSISYQGLSTVLFDIHDDPKSSSLAKSIMLASSLQLELDVWFLGMLDEMIGASSGGSFVTGPSLCHILPICFSAASALSSIKPSRLGATFSIKLQSTLFKGISVSLTSFTGSFTGSLGKSVFQNQCAWMGKHARAGMSLLSFDMRCPAPIS